jgi:hypothetical protein
MLFNNLFHTAKKTQHFTVVKISLLKLFKEIIIHACSENHTKSKNTFCGQNAELLLIGAGMICSCLSAFKG